jgi:hypothetical protein
MQPSPRDLADHMNEAAHHNPVSKKESAESRKKQEAIETRAQQQRHLVPEGVNNRLAKVSKTKTGALKFMLSRTLMYLCDGRAKIATQWADRHCTANEFLTLITKRINTSPAKICAGNLRVSVTDVR